MNYKYGRKVNWVGILYYIINDWENIIVVKRFFPNLESLNFQHFKFFNYNNMTVHSVNKITIGITYSNIITCRM